MRPISPTALARRAIAATSLVAAALLAGCRASPISMDGERSQFDRHDALQGDWTPGYTENEFGRMVPNLRGRLLHR